MGAERVPADTLTFEHGGQVLNISQLVLLARFAEDDRHSHKRGSVCFSFCEKFCELPMDHWLPL